MRQWQILALTGALALCVGCSDDAVPGDVIIQPGDASLELDEDVTPEVSRPDVPPVRDTTEPPPEEPLDPIVEACVELFPPLCGKMIECVAGDTLGDLFAPACDLLMDGGQGILVTGCEALTGAIPGGEFLGDLAAELLFPVIQECIEDFACTPENIAYFAGAFGDLFTMFSGEGGGFDFSSIGDLIDLFTDCDEPPPSVEPEPEPDVISDVNAEDVTTPDDVGPQDDALTEVQEDTADEDAPNAEDSAESDSATEEDAPSADGAATDSATD